MNLLNPKSRFLFVTCFALVAVFAAALLRGGIVATPVNAAADGWHIKDDTTGGECALIGNWDTASKTCALSQDLNQGIIIDNNNIILDGNGHTITGSNTGNGVYLFERMGVTIKNLNINKFAYGILLDSSHNNTLIGNTASNNDFAGIVLSGSNNNTLTGNTSNNNNLHGIFLNSSSNNTLTSNTSNNNSNTSNKNSYGIFLNSSSNNNTLIGNTVSNNNFDGILLISSSNNTLTSNTASNNLFGIYIGLSSNNILVNNSTNLNYYNGIRSFLSNSNTFTGNIANYSNFEGIVLYASNNNTLTGNTTNFNAIGIGLEQSSADNILVRNTVNLNKNYGIEVGYRNTLTGNTITSNGNYGIALGDYGGSKIYNNNFVDNPTQIAINIGNLNTDNIFNLAVPIGGNYYSNFDTPSEGCADINNDGFCDSPYAFFGGQDNLPWTKKDGWLAPPKTLPDLSIEEIKPFQVIEKADVNDDGTTDLVLGKPAIVRVRPKIIAPEEFNENQIVTELYFGSNILSTTTTIAELKSIAGDPNGYLDFFITPITEGDTELSVFIDSNNSIAEQNELNNQVQHKLTIKKTNNLRLAYIPFIFPSFPENFLETSLRSTEFIDATYPVADVLGEYSTSEFVPGLLGRIGDKTGVNYDLLGFWLWGKLQYPFSDQIFGVVSHDYFSYHGMEGTVGGHPAIGLNAVSLVTDDYWTAAAHELGHAYGLWMSGPEEYDLYDTGRDASGYWVRNQTEIKNGRCFMGIAGQQKSFQHNSTVPVWVDNEDYKLLFKEFLVDKTDPEVLLLSGWIERGGAIFVNPLYKINGNIDEISGDEYTIDLLDFNGNIIDTFGFDVSFQFKSNPPVELDVAPFALTVPYYDNIQEVRILKAGKVVMEVNSNTRLLHDAIDSIPANGFTKGNENGRVTLHNKVDALEKQLKSNNYTGAVENLKNDIRKKIIVWLADYRKETPLVLTKEEILNLIDSIVGRIVKNSPTL